MTTTTILLSCLLFFILGAAAMRFGLGPALRERDEWRASHAAKLDALHPNDLDGLMSEALNDPIVKAAHDRNRALRERYVSAPIPGDARPS